MAGAVDVDGNIRDSDDDKPQERGVGAKVQGGHLYISSSSIYEILRNEALFTNSHLGQSVRGIQSSNKDPMVYRGRSAALKSSRLYGKLRCHALCLLRTAMAQPNGMHSGTQRERRSCCVWGWIYGWRLAIMGILLNCVFLSSESWIRHPFVCFLSSLSHGLTIEGHHIVDTQFSSIFHTPVNLGFSIGSLHLGVPHIRVIGHIPNHFLAPPFLTAVPTCRWTPPTRCRWGRTLSSAWIPPSRCHAQRSRSGHSPSFRRVPWKCWSIWNESNEQYWNILKYIWWDFDRIMIGLW